MGKRAEMGIGTLIIFIAMILVAAIAAGVLIQTASSLQNKALLTGERSKSQISTNIVPVTMYAEDGSTNNNVDTFYLNAKLAPGSDSIRFSDVLIEVDLHNVSYDLNFFDALCNETNGTGFMVTHSIQGVNYEPGYLQRGDVVKICFETAREVGEDESVSFAIIPKIGTPTTIESAMPDIITEQRVMIYP